MAFTLLPVLVLGVIAAAADDVPVTWSSSSRAALQCVIPDVEKLLPRRPPPPLDAEDRIKSKPFIWRRDNEEIKRVPWNGTLEVLKRKDGSGEGVYQCAVKHHGGLILGYPVHLKFAYIDRQFTVNPSNSTAYTGQPFILSCEINSGPPAVITWQKDNEALPQNSRYHVMNNQLLITEVKKEDAGAYRCKATNINVNKTRYSHSGRLLVEDYSGDVEITLLPIKSDHSLYVSRGSRVVLPCPVTGWPKPKLIWELTPPGGRTGELEAVDQILVLPNIEYDQEGVYTCTVEGNSDLTMNYNVTIIEPVSITIPPASKQSLQASTVRFNCTAAGRPAPTVTWYKDGKPLVLIGRIAVLPSVDGKRRELLIRSVTSNDAGVYQCVATGAGGVGGAAAAWGVLEVREAEAAAPRRAWCEPVGARTVHVRWPHLPNAIAYIVQTTSPGGSSLPGQPVNKTDKDINVEVPLAPYEFQVRAFIHLEKTNKTIASDFSKTITCSGQGVPVKLEKVGDDAILVSWKKFHDRNPGVVQWMLQYRAENSTEEHNVTLDGSVFNYSLEVSPDKVVQVRVLGSRSEDWLQQNLTLVPWTSSSFASPHNTGAVRAVPEKLEATEVGPREFRLRWTCNEAKLYPDMYTYVVCTRMLNRNEDCVESYMTSVTIHNLQPNTEYEVRVQARLAGAPPDGQFSTPLRVKTQPEEPKAVQWEWVGAGVRVWWEGGQSGVTRVVRYSQNLTHSLETWTALNLTGNSVTITGLDPTQLTYVMLSMPGPSQRSQVVTVQPRPPDNSMLYIGVGAACGVLLLCTMAAAAVCIWRRRKRSRSPVRSRRRRASSANGEEDEYSEMKAVGGRLANGASSKDVGEPLLNGHVHITENPTSKTPNGKMRKGRKQELMFDVSRNEEPDVLVETVAGEADVSACSGLTAYTLLDTSRRPEYEGSFAKLPDDNMNSEPEPATLELQGGTAQPTLQPNG